MRLIILFLLLSLGGQAQIIRAQPFYVPLGCSGLLLDCYPNAAAAYSLRKLNSSYTGNCIEVRRSSDNFVANIGFDSNGNLDTATLKSFIGANSGFIRTWYDQSGNGKNATQTSNNAFQPRIINSGVIERQNLKPTIFFDSTNDRMNTTHVLNYPFSTFNILKSLNTGSNAGVIISNAYWTSLSAGQWAIAHEAGFYKYRGSGTIDASVSALTSLYLGYAGRISNNGYAGINSGSLSSSSGLNSTQYSGNTFIGGNPSSTPPRLMYGYISEIIIYNSDQSSNRSKIETNINNYYSIF